MDWRGRARTLVNDSLDNYELTARRRLGSIETTARRTGVPVETLRQRLLVGSLGRHRAAEADVILRQNERLEMGRFADWRLPAA